MVDDLGRPREQPNAQGFQLNMYMRFGRLVLAAGLLWQVSVQGQVTIKAEDLFNQIGLYYRAYANQFDPASPSSSFVVGDIAGTSGPGQFWDFSTGPKDKVLRFDYVDASTTPMSQDFPLATLAERKTDESDGSAEYLFFRQEAGSGRLVYGMYAEVPYYTPLFVFQPPAVDFPEQIAYGQQWTAGTTYDNEISFLDPDPEEGGEYNVLLRHVQTSQFRVDAHGTIVLPDEIGFFGEGLRINEEVTLEITADFGDGTFEPLETDYMRNFYWVLPGYGIVAQLNSTQGSSPPPENFTRATAFIRMFETNKDPNSGGGNTDPTPITDLRIRVNSNTVLLTWSRAPGATQYRLEYSTNGLDQASWTPLGDPTPNNYWQLDRTSPGPVQFYRVVSLK
jgi:hypothetical protein